MTPRVRSALLTLALVALATAFATGSTFARLSYDSGATALAVNTARSLCAAAMLVVVLRAQGVALALPAPILWRALGLGVFLAAYSWSLFVAIGLMPVALAIVVFYTWPFMVGIGAWSLGQERLTWLWPVAAGIAFVGLGLALGLGPGTPAPDAAGVAYALAGAAGWAVLLLLNRRLVGRSDSRPVTLWMLVSAIAVYALAAVLFDDFRLPETTVGWAAFAVSAGIYSVLPMSVFVLAAAAGPVRTALVMNFEPIASMILTALILDQVLAPLQMFGAVLVVASLTLARGASRSVAP
ncbi:MAG: DMT family transporter [Alphaproteobacteria bacterium]|nr:DMT family transporter [Alphaproteobacteria bacterium]